MPNISLQPIKKTKATNVPNFTKDKQWNTNNKADDKIAWGLGGGLLSIH